jgi:hypothetical protein
MFAEIRRQSHRNIISPRQHEASLSAEHNYSYLSGT